tara:strand:- start:123 stop:911 length:789 start_codon:yes stop_codon:yes gene_type:complete
MRKRRHYGTTGGDAGRMIIDVSATFETSGELYHDDPKLFDSEGISTRSAMMGDIVHLPQGDAELSVSVTTSSPIIRIDIFNGLDLIETVRPYTEDDLGSRIRLHWEGAEYRGRFREVIWDGSASIEGNTIERIQPVNFLNRDKTLDQLSDHEISWRALTTGNFGGADLALADAAAGKLSIRTPLVETDIAISDIGYEDHVFNASGELPRFLKFFRLPDINPHRSFAFTRKLELKPDGDNPIYIRLEQEDGTRAWTSPIYLFR